MSYVQEGYQRGPLHVGEVKIYLRPYVWSDEDIANYRKMREYEDLELLGVIDASVKAAMEALGDELEKYLEEAGEKLERKPEEPPKRPPGLFTSLGKGFVDLTKAFKPTGSRPSGPKLNAFMEEQEKKRAMKDARYRMWFIYKNYKKAHKMIAW